MSNNYIYVLSTNKHYRRSIDLLPRILQTGNNVLFYLYRTNHHHDIYYKLLKIIKEQFNDYLINQKLFFDTYKTENLNLINMVFEHKQTTQFNRYIFLDPTNIYFDKFFKQNIDDTNDITGVKPYQCIEPNLKIRNDSDQYTWCLSHKAVSYCIKNHIRLSDLNDLIKNNKLDLIHNIKSTNNMLSYGYTTQHKYAIWEKQFQLLYLIESNNDFKDSYCFFYTNNNKCMNIDNNMVGIFEIDHNQEISIQWEDRISKYIKAEDSDCYVLIDTIKNL